MKLDTIVYDIFISYAQEDEYWVKGYLLPLLSNTNLSIITSNDFKIGKFKIDEIERLIINSKYTFLIFSPSFILNEWSSLTEQLISHFSTEEGRNSLIPIKLKPVKLPLRIEFRILLDFLNPDNWNSELKRLLDFLEEPVAKYIETTPCPYPGMIPFKLETSSNFFGRDSEIQQILYTIRQQKILCIIGASGSGKSSLVFGGFLPALKSTTFYTQGYWAIRDMRPVGDPVQKIKALLNAVTEDFSTAVTNMLQELAPSQKLLLIVDQFEELFTITEKTKAKEFIAILQNLKTLDNCFILLTMRASFYQDLLNSDLWPLHPPEKLELTPLKTDALAAAIMMPAQNAGVYFEQGLLEAILKDASSEPGVLPLIQELMILLWEKKINRLITFTSYKSLGKSGLGVAISMKADSIFYSLSIVQQRIAKRIFIRLIQFGEGRPDTRRQQPLESLVNSLDKQEDFLNCLELLTNNRLLTFDGEEFKRETNIDISHESLIESWSTLSTWIKEVRESEQIRRRLQTKADEWIRLGKKNGGLLDIVEIAESESWIKSFNADEIGFSADIPALIKSSIESQQKIEQEKKGEQEKYNKRLRKRALFLSIFLGLTIFMSLIAFRQLTIAKSRRLAAEALITRDQIDNALNLSMEAYKINSNDETKSSLLSLLQQSSQFYKILKGNTSFAWKVKINPNGKTAATGHSGGAIFIWDMITGKQIIKLENKNKKTIFTFDYSSDGKFLASGSADGSLIIWDMASYKPIDTLLQLKDKSIYSIAFSADNKYLAAGCGSKEIRVFDFATKKEIFGSPLKKQKGNITALAFSPTAPILASGADDNGTVMLWNIAQMKMLSPDPLNQNGGDIYALAFSPDGTMLVSGSGGPTDQNLIVWDVASQISMGFPLIGHTNSVMDLVFTPTGDTLFSCGADNKIIAWNMNIFSVIKTYTGHWEQVNSISLNKEGTKLLSSAWDNNLIIWDLSRANLLAETIDEFIFPLRMIKNTVDGMICVDNNGNINQRNKDDSLTITSQQTKNPFVKPMSLAISPKNALLFCGLENGGINIWDIKENKLLSPFIKAHIGSVDHLELSKNEQILASGGTDGLVFLWDLSLKKQLGPCLKAHRGEVNDLSFSPDGKYLSVAYDKSSVIIWDINTFTQVVPPICVDGYMQTTQFNSDGTILAIGGSYSLKGEVRFYDVLKKELSDLIPIGLNKPGSIIRFSKDSRKLIYGGEDGLIIWDIYQKKVTNRIVATDVDHKVDCISISPDNNVIVAGLQGQQLKILYDKSTKINNIETASGISDVSFINDSLFAAIGSDSAVTIYNCYTLKIKAILQEKFDAYINNVDYYPEKNFVATGASDGKVRFSDLSHPENSRIIIGSRKSIRGIVFNQHKNTLIFGGLDSIVQVRDLSNFNKVVSLFHIGDQITTLSCSHNGNIIAVGTNSGEVLLFDTKTYKQINKPLEGHTRNINCIAFSRDDEYIATGSYDRLINIWNTQTQTLYGLPFMAHENAIWSLQFSKDGKILVSSGDDGKINIWDIAKHTRFGSSFRSDKRIWTLEFSTDGNYLYSGGEDKKLTRWNLDPTSWMENTEKISSQ